MNPSTLPHLRACLSCLIFLLIGNTVNAQVTTQLTYPEFMKVDIDFIKLGKTHFKNDVKKPKLSTDRVTVSYKTLDSLIHTAAVTDSFVFVIVGIDKNDKLDQAVWQPIFGVTDLKDYDKHQAIIFGIKPPMPSSPNATAPPGTYYALGRLCPPPVCPGY